MRGRVLILAGTAEARAVCTAVAGCDVLASLAGVTRVPKPLGVPTRLGGFGGEAGFRTSLTGVSAVLDATHPFATAMTARAVSVCAGLGLPYLRLTRVPWRLAPEWCRHADAAEAAAALPDDARVFLAVGPGAVALFLGRGARLWCRRIDPAPEVSGLTWIVGPPKATAAEEGALFRDLGITHLVTKNSGGNRAKLDAAARLGLAVEVIDRPPPAEGEETHDIATAIAFVRRYAAPLPDHPGG